jgi:uncharacterized protein (TIGR00106 family)
MALMQISAVPLGSGSTSVGEFVAGIVKILDRKGVVYTLTDMGTVLEGDIEDLLELAGIIHEAPFQKGAKRVVTQITIDDRRDRKVAIGDKISSVINRLNISDG